MALLNLPTNWKEDPKYWQPIANSVAGIKWKPSDSVLDGYVTALERTLGNRISKSQSLLEVLESAATGGGFNKDAINKTFSLVGLLNDIKDVLSPELKKIYDEKNQQAQSILQKYGNLSPQDASNRLRGLSDRGGIEIQSGLLNNISSQFNEEITGLRKLLDTESNIRNKRPLSPGDLEIIAKYKLDQNSPTLLNDIQSNISSIKGLEPIRQAAIDQNKEKQDRLAQQTTEQAATTTGRSVADAYKEILARNVQPETATRSVADAYKDILYGRTPQEVDRVAAQSSASAQYMPFVEKASVITGIDIDRAQQIQDNIKQYMIDTGADLETARMWALKGKDPRSAEFQAVNLIVDGAKFAQRTPEDPVEGLRGAKDNADKSLDGVIDVMLGDDEVLDMILDRNVLPRELTDAQLKELTAVIRKKVGGKFDEDLRRAIEDHNITKRFARENLDKILETVNQDLSSGIKRLDEDTAISLRNIQASLAEQGLTRGGVRKRREELLALQKQRTLEDIQGGAKRAVESDLTEFERKFGTDEAPQLRGAIAQLGVQRSPGVEEGVIDLEQRRREEDLKKAREEAIDVALKQDIGDIKALRLQQTF